MSLQAKMDEIFNNWDKEAFRATHHPDYMFIREFEMVTLDDHVETINELMLNGYDVHKRWTLIHENDYVGEIRWEEDDEIITHVILKKDGLHWRGFVNRVKKPEVA
jgi:hypothetical protein